MFYVGFLMRVPRNYLRLEEQSAHSIASGENKFRVGAGNQVAMYGERVAPVEKSVNPTSCEHLTN